MSTNKPWKNESFHDTFQAADAIRQKLLKIWTNNPSHQGMQVKVKWMSSRNKFAVKTRLDPSFTTEKENKKNGKSRKGNKKNSNEGKFDPTTSV